MERGEERHPPQRATQAARAEVIGNPFQEYILQLGVQAREGAIPGRLDTLLRANPSKGGGAEPRDYGEGR